MDIDKNKLIKRLKVVKDPRERDRIIWALAGHEKKVASDTPKPAATQKTVLSPLPGQKQKLPSLPLGARQLFAYFVPGLFLFFGFMNLGQALMRILPDGKVETAIPQLVMGTIFLLFGITGIIKAGKKAKGLDKDTDSGERSPES